jgi:hypothetical protein
MIDEIEVVESLPGRPLTHVEIAALADADSIKGVEPTSHHPETLEIMGVALANESDEVLLAYHPERCQWEVVERWDREEAKRNDIDRRSRGR